MVHVAAHLHKVFKESKQSVWVHFYRLVLIIMMDCVRELFAKWQLCKQVQLGSNKIQLGDSTDSKKHTNVFY